MPKLPKYIWIKGKRLYLYDYYSTRQKAFKIAKHFQKKLKNNYFILKTEGSWMPKTYWGLYMNKVYTL